jgi:hypothetical protein
MARQPSGGKVVSMSGNTALVLIVAIVATTILISRWIRRK